MSFKDVFGLFICSIYLCSVNPVQIGDDKSNWEAVWKELKNNSAVSRSGDKNIFDEIVRINAKARGRGIGRRDDKVFLFEGDIEMSKTDVYEHAVKKFGNTGKSRQARAVLKNDGRNLWSANIPYAISRSLSAERSTIQNAVKEFEQTLNCLGNWRDVTSTSRPKDYIYFSRGRGCYSKIGKVGGQQRISIGSGCKSRGIVVHEIGHALGLYHEQARPDRDNYVTILWNNIIPATRFNFRKQPSWKISSFGVGYDYASIMHYGAYAFSRNRQPTILSKQAGVRFGQRRGLSDKDKEQLRKLYGCTTAVIRPSGCQGNERPDWVCNYWQGRGFCRKRFVKFMKKNCCKACGVVVVSCTNKNISGFCPKWVKYGYCVRSSRYSTFMKNNCAKSCGCI